MTRSTPGAGLSAARRTPGRRPQLPRQRSKPLKESFMARWAWSLGIGLAILAQTSAGRAAELPLIRETDMPLDGAAGRIDHLAFDPKRQHLVIAELGNGTVDVV